MTKTLLARLLKQPGILLALTLTSCAPFSTLPEQQQGAEIIAEQLSPSKVQAKTSVVVEVPSVELTRAEPTILKGTDKQIKSPSARPGLSIKGEAVSLNFEQAPLTEVVHAILGDTLNLDYIVEHPISGEITLRTQKAVPRDQLLEILESLLQANGAFLLRDNNNRFIVSASAQMSKLRPAFEGAGSKSAGFSNVIVPLTHIGAVEMAEILKPVATENSFVRIDPVRNLLVLAGSRAQLDGWLDIVRTFDVDMLAGMSVGIFPLKETSPTEAEKSLKAILETALGAEAGISTLVRIVPMDHLNSLMIITPRGHYLEQVKNWIDRIDQHPDEDNERRLFVYSVQNATAADLARLMSSVFEGSGKSGSSANTNTADTSGVAPGLTPTTIGSSTGASTGGSTTTTTPSSSTGRNKTGSGSANVSVGDIRIIAEESNNSLLIYASRNEFKKIEQALLQLDIMPTQIAIEATIMEVTLTEDLSYGLSWYLNNNLGNGWTGVGEAGTTVSAVAGGFNGTTGKVSGLNYSVFDSVGDLRGIINALASKSLVNILSTPNITVLDNQTASIQVGTEQPVQSGTSVTDGGFRTNSITYRDTGVVLEVTPSVNSAGMVTMTVKQSITDVGDIEAATGQRPFLKRDINTRIAVRSGEAAVLGGLIRENTSNGRSGIPLLKDLPILGNFFGGTSKTKNRTELLVMITPRVIKDGQDLQDVTREMQRKMSAIKLSENMLKIEDSH